jgi:MFS family permease
MNTDPGIKLGLMENWKQFSLLVIINGFVGGMLGIERTLIPSLAKDVFGINSFTAILSFIIVFGTVKAFANLYAGTLATRIGKKNLLVIGWIAALPVPFMLIYAPSWNWVLFANIFLGINQGLCWSTSVMMKIDLVGTKNRGLAMGFNEFAGYLSLALIAFLTGHIAAQYGLKPYPFYLGIFLALTGLFGSLFFIKDTAVHVLQEAAENSTPQVKNIFLDTTLRNKNLSSVTQAGLINNLNDGMIWGLFPLLLKEKGFNFSQIGIIVAIYPAVWGISQLLTGILADKFRRKTLLFWGMLLQGVVLFALALSGNFYFYVVISVLLGLGTAMVYPTFLAAVADFSHPNQRAQSIGIFRFWRDSGYVFGAIITGIIIDDFNTATAIIAVAVLTILSALVILFRMNDRKT